MTNEEVEESLERLRDISDHEEKQKEIKNSKIYGKDNKGRNADAN